MGNGFQTRFVCSLFAAVTAWMRQLTQKFNLTTFPSISQRLEKCQIHHWRAISCGVIELRRTRIKNDRIGCAEPVEREREFMIDRYGNWVRTKGRRVGW
jgi:hypothetical protein